VPHTSTMNLTRCGAVAVAYVALLMGPASLGSPKLLPLSAAYNATLLSILRWAWGALLVWHVNRVLSEWAENNWIFSSNSNTRDWKNEVAVVTGGSGGIGALVVKKLVSHGIRVAVLDVEPLSSDYQPSVSCPFSLQM
jgi:all-trans-retinol dehydrogenase (NAD+)